MVKAYRTIASRPDREVEARSSGSGPVKTSKMSPEEMEDYFARIADKRPAEPPKKGIDIPMRKANLLNKDSSINESKLEEEKAMVHKPKEIDKDEVIKLIAEGLSYTKIEQELGMPQSTLPYRLKKWGIPKLRQQGARQLLNDEPLQPVTAFLREKEVKPPTVDVELNILKDKCVALEQERDALLGKQKLLSAYNSELFEAHKIAADANNKHLIRISELETEIAKWYADDSETQELILEIMSERDQLKKLNEKLEYDLLEMTEDRDNWRSTTEELKAKLETTFVSVDSSPNVGLVVGNNNSFDMVNHPDHYKVGGIETIDFIRAKLSPEEFEGYCKGNVLKYVARASHKGGLEDLRKAGKYIDFAVGENHA